MRIVKIDVNQGLRCSQCREPAVQALIADTEAVLGDLLILEIVECQCIEHADAAKEPA